MAPLIPESGCHGFSDNRVFLTLLGLYGRSSRYDVSVGGGVSFLPFGPVADFKRLSRPFRSFARMGLRL